MKSQREIYEALLAGKKLVNQHGTIFYLSNDGHISHSCTFIPPENWSIYTEPKKKIILYEILYENNGIYYKPDRMVKSKEDAVRYLATSDKLIKLIPIEIEVSE